MSNSDIDNAIVAAIERGDVRGSFLEHPALQYNVTIAARADGLSLAVRRTATVDRDGEFRRRRELYELIARHDRERVGEMRRFAQASCDRDYGLGRVAVAVEGEGTPLARLVAREEVAQ